MDALLQNPGPNAWQLLDGGEIDLWIKIAYTLFVCMLVPVYWARYGPANFLWFSDIALFVTGAALWLESSLLASMMAVGVLLFESIWVIDFFIRLFAGTYVTGLTSYMFDSQKPLYLRGLSLFHLVLPALLIWLLYRLGYDPHAWVAQTVLAWVVLPATYFLTEPSDNINWVFGPGDQPQTQVQPPVYLIFVMLFLPVVVYLPTHVLLRSLFEMP